MDIDPPCRYIAAMVKMEKAFTAILSTAAALLLAVAPGVKAQPGIADEPLPRGIILIIGDGMGPAHFALTRLLRGDAYEIGRLPEAAVVGTPSADSRATDSAAAATAYASGIKTNNNYIGVDPAGVAHTTVVEIAEQRGLATGLVTTAPFGDATPAAFAAHTTDRDDIVTIAGQLIGSGVDILASSNHHYFDSEQVPPLEAFANTGGYEAVRTTAELEALGPGPVLAIFPPGGLDADSPEISLSQLAAWSIERLAQNPDGFFLLLEHEGTDSASHANDMVALEKALLSLEETVSVAMDFARAQGDILVIVTSDHETGGLKLAGKRGARIDTFTSRDHTAEDIPLFAFGPGAAAFNGYMENTEVGQRLLSLIRRLGN